MWCDEDDVLVPGRKGAMNEACARFYVEETRRGARKQMFCGSASMKSQCLQTKETNERYTALKAATTSNAARPCERLANMEGLPIVLQFFSRERLDI